jgi:ribosomal protein L40E
MVKCPSCGSDNPAHVVFCGRCGESIPAYLRAAEEQGIEVPSSTSEASASEQLPMKRCNWCGEQNKWSANFCTKCGKDPHAQPVPHEYLSDAPVIESKRRSGLPVAGGILSILAGFLGIAQGLLYLATESMALDLGLSGTEELCFCGALSLVFGLAGFAGGVFAVQRKGFGLALTGAILGMLSIGFVIGAVLGLVGMILIAVSKEEF